MVIAIMGVLMAIAAPMASNLPENMRKAKAMRDAQTIASISASLASIGYDHVEDEENGGALATATTLRDGVTISEGTFEGLHFSIGDLDDEDLSRAVDYLLVQSSGSDRRLIYNPPIGSE